MIVNGLRCRAQIVVGEDGVALAEDGRVVIRVVPTVRNVSRESARHLGFVDRAPVRRARPKPELLDALVFHVILGVETVQDGSVVRKRLAVPDGRTIWHLFVHRDDIDDLEAE
jgi:hypothetical protein